MSTEEHTAQALDELKGKIEERKLHASGHAEEAFEIVLRLIKEAKS